MKNTKGSPKIITTSDMIKGGVIGLLLGVAFYIILTIIWGAQDDIINMGMYLSSIGAGVGMFGGLIERFRSLKALVALIALSLLVSSILMSIYWVFYLQNL